MNSFVDNAIVSTRRKRQQNRKLLNQKDAFADFFSIKQDNRDSQNESRESTVGENVPSTNTNQLIPVNGSQVVMQTIERSITNRVRSDKNNIVVTVETKVIDAILAAICISIAFRVGLLIKSINASSERDPGSVILNPDRRDFSGNADGFQMNASSWLDSISDLNRLDEACSNITVEVGDLFVNEGNSDQQTYTYHNELEFRISSQKSCYFRIRKQDHTELFFSSNTGPFDF